MKPTVPENLRLKDCTKDEGRARSGCRSPTHLRAAPKGLRIDPLAVATSFAQRQPVSVDDICNVVRVEAERAGVRCTD